MMSCPPPIRETTNHFYSPDDLLGKGATCEVYKGISKSGEYRALKIFLGRGKNSDIRREVAALRDLQHKNVVVFYSLENDIRLARPVVVTELCENGSLQDVLNEIEFKYGLDEDEFLLVFRHLVDGIHHLRQNGFVHRDIKPGNILRCKDENGKSLYKLSDFGTARFLEDDDQFLSLVGTEEYLHPNLYNAAFLKPHPGGTFDAKVDLWSLGATLYHCATGTVPFRPYGGRADKQARYDMMIKRPEGVIGGIQLHQGGKIGWIKELPPATSLSRGLKRLITPLIAGLLPIHEADTWTFEVFFSEAENILNKTSLTILSTVQNPTWRYQIYLDPEDSFQDLQIQLHEQTGISPENQIIFYQDTAVQGIASIHRCCVTSLDRPMIVLCREQLKSSHKPCAYLEEIQGDLDLKFSLSMDMFHDLQIASMVGGHINAIHKQCLIASSLQEHTIELELKLRQDLKRNFELAKTRRYHMKELHFEMRHVVYQTSKQTKDDDMWPISVDILLHENEMLLDAVEEDLASVLQLVNEETPETEEDWCYKQSSCSCKCLRSLTQASQVIDRMTQKRNILTKRRKVTYDGLQHNADKKQLLTFREQTIKLWSDHCLLKTRTLVDRINVWSWSHIKASDRVSNSLKLLEDLRLSNLKILKLLRQESPDVFNDDSQLMSIDKNCSIVKTYSKRSSDLKVLTSELPDVYELDAPDDNASNKTLPTIVSEDQSMGTFIL